MQQRKHTYKDIATGLKKLSLSKSTNRRRGKRAKTSPEPPPPTIHEIDDIDIFKELSKRQTDFGGVLSSLEEEMKDHHGIVLRTFLLLFLRLLGLDVIANLYQEADIKKLNTKELLDKIHGFYEMAETEPPIPILGSARSKIIVKNTNLFLAELFLENDQIIYKTKLLSCIFFWFQALSQCNVRLIRLAVLELIHLMVKNALPLLEKIEIDSQRLKGMESEGDKLKNLENKIDFVDKFMDEMFKEVILPRERDIRNEIRNKFVDIIEFLVLKGPRKFLSKAALGSLTRVILRKEELEQLKCQVLGIFIKLYDKQIKKFDEYNEFLADYLHEKDFAKNIFNLAMNSGVRSSEPALQLILLINEKFPNNPISDITVELDQLLVIGSKEARGKTASLILKRLFESPETSNKSFSAKIINLISHIKIIGEEKIKVNINRRFELFLEEAAVYLSEKSEVEDWIKFILDKASIKQMKRADLTINNFLQFLQVFLEKLGGNKPEFLTKLTNVCLTDLKSVVDIVKHEPASFHLLLKTLALLDIACFSTPDAFESLKYLIKSIKSSLSTNKNIEFFSEVLSQMTSLSKVSAHLKEVAEDLINKLVSEEMQSFQSSFVLLYRNHITNSIKSVDDELIAHIRQELQRVGLLLKFFKIPCFLDEDFLKAVNAGCQERMNVEIENSSEDEKKTLEDVQSEIRGFFLAIMGLAHYWHLREIFQEPDDMQNYGSYLKIREFYITNLVNILSNRDESFTLVQQALELSISLLCLVSNDKMAKLKGIYIPATDALFQHILRIIEENANNEKRNLIKPIFQLFSEPFQSLKIMMSLFGKSFMKNAFYDAFWGKRDTINHLNQTLRLLKDTESHPQNKTTLTFWRVIQDIIFEIINDHSLSNDQQLDVGLYLCKTVIKVYFASGNSQKDSLFLEKYIVFLADTLVRGFENSSNLLSFCFLNSLVHKPILEIEHARKLRDFFKIERRKAEELLEGKGKKLEKMENYSSLEKLAVTLEKLAAEKKSKKEKEKKDLEKMEEEKVKEKEMEQIITSKRKEIQEEIEEKRKELEEDDKDFETLETNNILEFNKEERPRRKAQKRKVK